MSCSDVWPSSMLRLRSRAPFPDCWPLALRNLMVAQVLRYEQLTINCSRVDSSILTKTEQGWQWIFLIEGLIPVALSFVMWKILPDSPETAKFLTPDERDILVRRIANDSGSGQGKITNSDKIKKEHIIAGLSDWKIWAATVIFWGNTVGVYGYVQF